MPLTPVHFFSHGSTAMLGEESDSADYWQRCGQAALDNGIEHVVIMGAHWVTTGDSIQIATNPTPAKNPIGGVHPSKYVPYHLNPDLPMCNRIQQLLQSAGFNATPNPTVDWIHDIYLILIRTFPKQCPPTTVLSLNARFDPHYHLRVGAALRPLRHERVLFIGSGGTVHNLYRNTWGPLLRYADNFAMEAPPGDWALAFRQEMEDAVTKAARKGSGVGLRKAVTGLLKVPGYREAHATDDHIMSLMFVAGLVGDVEDTGDARSEGVEIGAEDWELTNMCNTQFTFGRW